MVRKSNACIAAESALANLETSGLAYFGYMWGLPKAFI